MKKVREYLLMFLIGLLVSIVIYPVLHELGHGAVSMLVGNEVVSVELFPVPNILCKSNKARLIEFVMVGFGGIFFPVIVTGIIRIKKFWIWYANVLLKGINIFAFALSLCAVAWENNQMFAQDDVRVILDVWENGKFFCVVLFIIVELVLLIDICNERPLKNCIKYLMK